MSIDKRDN